jgi:hypothetical protein
MHGYKTKAPFFRKPTALVVLWLLGHHGRAQLPGHAYWFTLQVPVQISSKWQWHNDGGYRTLGGQTAPQQYFYRTGIRYQWGHGLNAAVGTAFFFTRTSFSKANGEFGREWRLWQEVQYRHALGRHTALQVRFRPEQRFFAATTQAAAFKALRLRYRLGLTQQLSAKWQVQLANEYMHQAKGRRLAFNQHRAMAWGIYQWQPHTQLQFGYMWLQWPRAQHQHILQFTLFKTIGQHANSKHGNKK